MLPEMKERARDAVAGIPFTRIDRDKASGRTKQFASLPSGLLLVKPGKLLLEPFEFRHIVDEDVGLVRVQSQVVLMVFFGRIEAGERNYLGYDWLGECVFPIELRDVVFRHLLLSVVLIED